MGVSLPDTCAGPILPYTASVYNGLLKILSRPLTLYCTTRHTLMLPPYPCVSSQRCLASFPASFSPRYVRKTSKWWHNVNGQNMIHVVDRTEIIPIYYRASIRLTYITQYRTFRPLPPSFEGCILKRTFCSLFICDMGTPISSCSRRHALAAALIDLVIAGSFSLQSGSR